MLILVVVLFLLCWGPRHRKFPTFLQHVKDNFLLLRFIMETALKMGVLRFNNTVYWVRVGLFLLPFLHSISKTSNTN